MVGVCITGLENVEINLNKELEGIKVRSGKGLAIFAMRVRREMSIVTPTVPIKTRVMDHSWRSPITWSGGTYWVTMGFHAEYAPFVHDMDDASTHWTKKGSGSHWFEKALERNLPLLKSDIINN